MKYIPVNLENYFSITDHIYIHVFNYLIMNINIKKTIKGKAKRMHSVVWVRVGKILRSIIFSEVTIFFFNHNIKSNTTFYNFGTIDSLIIP